MNENTVDTQDGYTGNKNFQDMSVELQSMFQHANKASEMLKLIANESRLVVLCQLDEKARSVGELEELVGLSQSALSQHLAKLRKYGVVQTTRRGQQIFYEISDWRIRSLIKTLYDLYCNVNPNTELP